MKCKKYILLMGLLLTLVNMGLSSSFGHPPLSAAYQESDFVMMAKSKSTGLELDFEYIHFFKGRAKVRKSLRYAEFDISRLYIGSFMQDSTYLLFVKGEELYMAAKISEKPNLPLWDALFKELTLFLEMKPSPSQFNFYTNWLGKYLHEQEVQKVVLWELYYKSTYTWLCHDPLHPKWYDHWDCVIPPILNRQDQYYVLDIIQKRGRIGFEQYIFNHHFDSIAPQDLQKYFYSTFLVFYQQNLKDNDGSGFSKKWSNWGGFLGLFRRKTSNPELLQLMEVYFNTPESVHHQKNYLEDENNILFQITRYIQQNKPMFSTS
ncbi:hypothetical protein Halhy_1178 [Haliscomenobacter hydrossis DSM 1100]|uniref:Uncharacterized protein n=2 Tax=Haliscomenobacter TaxID=2349 RepID=F4KSW8_HALH1|nr:hypothetical protein Halhy_1178 [Haliscomenobacter hydrossis DSM 1100]